VASPEAARSAPPTEPASLSQGDLEGFWLPLSALGRSIRRQVGIRDAMYLDGDRVRFTYGCRLFRGRLNVRDGGTVAPVVQSRPSMCDATVTQETIGPDVSDALASSVSVVMEGPELLFRDAAGTATLRLTRVDRSQLTGG
jgi:hypothetical protein